jgi:hypothetical protein
VGHVTCYEPFRTQCEREGMLHAYQGTSYRRDIDDAVGQRTSASCAGEGVATPVW